MKYQITINGKISRATEIAKKYGMQNYKSGKGYNGYIAEVEETVASAFAAEEMPEGTWADCHPLYEGDDDPNYSDEAIAEVADLPAEGSGQNLWSWKF